MLTCYVFTKLPSEIKKHIQKYVYSTEIIIKYHMQIIYQGITTILQNKKKNLDKKKYVESSFSYYIHKINEVLKITTNNNFYIENIDKFLLLFSRDKYRNVRRLPRYLYLKELKRVFENLLFLEYDPFDRRGY